MQSFYKIFYKILYWAPLGLLIAIGLLLVISLGCIFVNTIKDKVPRKKVEDDTELEAYEVSKGSEKPDKVDKFSKEIKEYK